MENDSIIIVIMDCILILYSLILFIYNKCSNKNDYLSFKIFADNSKNLFDNDISLSMSITDKTAFNEKNNNNQLENLL